MRKFLFLFIFLILLGSPLVLATMAKIEIPFKYEYYAYNDTHTGFEIKNSDTEASYRVWRWPNGTDSSGDWELEYYIETGLFCNASTCSAYSCEAQTGGHNWSGDLKEMTQSLNQMINAFNQTSNLSLEVISRQDLLENYGRCLGRNGELYNQTVIANKRVEIAEQQRDVYQPYEGQYNSCKDNEKSLSDSKKNSMIIAFIAGFLISKMLLGKKPEIPPEAAEGGVYVS